MKKPANFASVLVIAAALSLWAARQAIPAEVPFGVPAPATGWSAVR